MQDQANDENRQPPWVPRRTRLRPVERTVSPSPSAGAARARAVWDVVWTFDGQRFFRRFDRARDAETFAADLHCGVAMGLPFDPVARRFVGPDPDPARLADPAPPVPETVGWPLPESPTV